MCFSTHFLKNGAKKKDIYWQAWDTCCWHNMKPLRCPKNKTKKPHPGVLWLPFSPLKSAILMLQLGSFAHQTPCITESRHPLPCPRFRSSPLLFVHTLNSQGASTLYSFILAVPNDRIPGLCSASFSPKRRRGEKESLTPPAASSSPQTDMKLKKLVSPAEFKGARDKPTGSCCRFWTSCCCLLWIMHIFASPRVSRVSPLFWEKWWITSFALSASVRENVRLCAMNVFFLGFLKL